MRIPNKAETKLLEPFKTIPLNQIFVPISKAEFIQATDEIKLAKVVGFDTETKPVFTKGEKSDGPHVVQFSLKNKAFIFQLHHSNCKKYLLQIFQSEDIVKVGFGLSSDHKHIYNKFGVKLKSVFDLNQVFQKKGYRSQVGARASIAIVFNQYFHKSRKTSTSNWALPKLSNNQLLYAANDAYVPLCVFNELGLVIENGQLVD